MSDDQIIEACRTHGAKVVREAANAALNGRRQGLVALGLGGLTMAAAYRSTVIASKLMRDEDRASDPVRDTMAAARPQVSASPVPPRG